MGNNDPCYCGSGKKYKKCCGSGRSIKNNEIINITYYGSEVIDRESLDKFNTFYVETTADEKFEITKDLNRYKLKDIIPPVMEKNIDNFRTMRFNEIQLKKLSKPNPRYEGIEIGKHEEFDGIIKGGRFGWINNGDNTCTKGTINKIYVKQDIGNTTLNINLFPPEAAYKPIDEYLDKGFKITTSSNVYSFDYRDDGVLYYEDKKVVAVFSLYDIENPYDFNTPDLLLKEYNVCYDIVLNKPFLVLTVKNENTLNICLINDKIIDIVESVSTIKNPVNLRNS